MDKFLIITIVILAFLLFSQFTILRAIKKERIAPKKVLDNLNENLKDIKTNTKKLEKEAQKQKIQTYLDNDWVGWVFIISFSAGVIVGGILGAIFL